LIYIDKDFKKQMEDFENIKHKTADCIYEFSDETDIVKEWKVEIRRNLMEVKAKILVWLDEIVNKFVDSLRLIET